MHYLGPNATHFAKTYHLALVDLASRRQRSLQYLTSGQFFSHFLRHAKGRPQVTQIFWGSSLFLICFGMAATIEKWGWGLFFFLKFYQNF
jgi:hypothetical protein